VGLSLQKRPRGLFVGISTVDSIFSVAAVPQQNVKVQVREWALIPGGPATNAAVAFQALGGDTTLASVLGSHPSAEIIRRELYRRQIDVQDMALEYEGPPAFASVIVSPGGDRLAVSTGACHLPQPDSAGNMLDKVRPDVVLIDGYIAPLALDAIRKARALGIPVVIDGGSWRDYFSDLLPHCDIAICSEDFAPPGVAGPEAIFSYLAEHGIAYRAVTRGERPILYECPAGSGSVPVETIEAVDTLGAGDIFHGAFAYAWACGEREFPTALAAASRTATLSCRYFGTRSWIAHL
jgi:sugar/nucleoside kinase (ribokinase family)